MAPPLDKRTGSATSANTIAGYVTRGRQAVKGKAGVPKSPSGQNSNEVPKTPTDMELILLKLDALTEEVKYLRSESKATQEAVSKINDIETDLDLQKSRWKVERDDIMEEIKALQRKEERRERAERSTNFTIKGLQVNREEDVREVIKDFLNTKLGVHDPIEKTVPIKKNGRQILTIVKMATDMGKDRVMKAKTILRGTEIYINQDRTINEREIQGKIRERAKKEEELGNKVWVGYRKLTINDKLMVWSDDIGLVESIHSPSRNARRDHAPKAGRQHLTSPGRDNFQPFISPLFRTPSQTQL